MHWPKRYERVRLVFGAHRNKTLARDLIVSGEVSEFSKGTGTFGKD